MNEGEWTVNGMAKSTLWCLPVRVRERPVMGWTLEQDYFCFNSLARDVYCGPTVCRWDNPRTGAGGVSSDRIGPSDDSQSRNGDSEKGSTGAFGASGK